MKNLLFQYAQYNVWANAKMCVFLEKINEPFLDKEIPSSFSSLRKTIYHIWNAETIWYKRLIEEPKTKWPPHSDFKGKFDEFKIKFHHQSQLMIDFVNNADETLLNKILRYQDSKGNNYTQPVWQCVMHCFNHSTYHRGQLVTLLRNVGFTDLSSTDLIAFFREA